MSSCKSQNLAAIFHGCRCMVKQSPANSDFQGKQKKLLELVGLVLLLNYTVNNNYQ